MRIKGLDRARKQRKRRYGMRVDGAAVRRVQLAFLQRALRQVRLPAGQHSPSA